MCARTFLAPVLWITTLVLIAGCGDSDYLVLGSDAGSFGGSGSQVGGVTSGAGGLDGGDPGGGQGGAVGAVVDAAAGGIDTGGTRDAAASCDTHADCIDADMCNGVELCVDGVCLPGTQVTCNDGNPCTTDACTPATGVCVFTAVADGAPCDDADQCDGEVCAAGECTQGTPVVCADDGNPCTSHVCEPATGSCVFSAVPTGTSCSDGDACNGAEVCGGGLCLGGIAIGCDDGNPCTADSCDAVTGCVHSNVADGTYCEDADLCDGREQCFGGVCQQGTALTCNDNNPCTVDVCNPQNGSCGSIPLPNETPCPDGDLCDADACMNGVCVQGPAIVCANDNDNNPCTANTCVPATGVCVPGNVPNGTPCPDGDFCDGTETCAAGTCSVPGTPLSCPDDGNPCTTDLCAPAAGCLHLNVGDGTSCADADLCDGAETCTGGTCTAGTPVVCTLPLACDAQTGTCS